MRTHNVLLLGPRGSGKTVFLSSMYYKLSMETETGFFIETESALKNRVLKKTYTQLLSGKSWPIGTLMGEIHDWKLDCFVRSNDKILKVFKVNYFDYSGGNLTDTNYDDDNEFQDLVKKTDIFLGLIDGEILFPESGYSDDEWIMEFDEVVKLISRNNKGKPIHFIISKWDLLVNRDIGIGKVLKKLMGFSSFKRLAENVKRDSSFIRIIPVSSVGFNFVKFENGLPKKNNNVLEIKEDAVLEPYNVDIPLALALLDPIHQEMMDRINKANEIAQEKVSAPDPELSWWEKVSRNIGDILEDIVDDMGIDISTVDEVVDYMKSSGQEKIDKAKEIKRRKEANLARKRAEIENESQAIEYIIDTFQAIEAKLEIEYPGSKI